MLKTICIHFCHSWKKLGNQSCESKEIKFHYLCSFKYFQKILLFPLSLKIIIWEEANYIFLISLSANSLLVLLNLIFFLAGQINTFSSLGGFMDRLLQIIIEQNGRSDGILINCKIFLKLKFDRVANILRWKRDKVGTVNQIMIPCHSPSPPCKMLLKSTLKPVQECCFQFAETARSPSLRVYLCFHKLFFRLASLRWNSPLSETACSLSVSFPLWECTYA